MQSERSPIHSEKSPIDSEKSVIEFEKRPSVLQHSKGTTRRSGCAPRKIPTPTRS